MPVDFTERSREALRLAVSLAADPEDRITLLHVIEPDPWLARGNAVMMTLGKGVGEQCAEAEERLRRWAAQEAGPDIEVGTVVRFGPAMREILRVAEMQRCDAIVLGTEPRHWLARLFQRGLARRLQKKAACAVLTICPPAKVLLGAYGAGGAALAHGEAPPAASTPRSPVRTAFPFPEEAVHFRPGQNRPR